MPVVRAPVYGEQQVGTSGLPSARLRDPGPTGMDAVARGVGQLAEVGSNAATGAITSEIQKAKREASLVQRTQADAAAQDFVTRRFYSKDGLFSKRSATELLDDEEKAFGEFDKTVSSLKDGFRSPEDQQAFLTQMSDLRGTLRRQTETHVAQRFEVEKVDSAKARIEKGLTNIQAGLWADPGEVAKEIARMQESAPLLAPSAEGQDVARKEIETKAWLTVVEQNLALSDAKGARDILTTHSDALGAHRAVLEKRIQAIEKDTTAESTASEIAAAASDPRGWMDEKKAEALLAKVPPGPERDEIEKRLDHKKTVARELKKTDIDTAVNAALSSYSKGGNNLGAIRGDLKLWLQEKAAGEWLKIEAMDRAEKRSARASNTEERRLQTELNTIAEQNFRVRSFDDRTKAVGLSIDSEYPDADRATREKIKAEQAKLRQQIAKGDDATFNLFTTTVNDGVKGLPKAQADKVRSQMQLWWIAATSGVKQPGDGPKAEDIRKEIGRITLYGDKGGWHTSTNKYASDVEDGEEFVPFPVDEQKSEFAKEYLRDQAGGSSSSPSTAAPKQEPAAAAPVKKTAEQRAEELLRAGKSDTEIDEIIFKEYGVHAH